MFKILGAFLVLGSCSLAGFSFGNKYARRVEQLRQFISALQLMQSEIGFTATPMLEVLSRLENLAIPPAATVFSEAEAGLASGNGHTAGEAWQEALKVVRPRLDLTRADFEILQRFGSTMGSGGREEQLKNLQLAQQQLMFQEREAAEERLKYERLYKTMGVLVGLAVVLVFV